MYWQLKPSLLSLMCPIWCQFEPIGGQICLTPILRSIRFVPRLGHLRIKRDKSRTLFIYSFSLRESVLTTTDLKMYPICPNECQVGPVCAQFWHPCCCWKLNVWTVFVKKSIFWVFRGFWRLLGLWRSCMSNLASKSGQIGLKWDKFGTL